MPPEVTGMTKRHITTACTFCRRRKIKCDGRLPICTNCEINKQTCKYNCEDDKRKLSYKKILDSQTARIKLLEQTLKDHGIRIPSEKETQVQDSPPGAASNPNYVSQTPKEVFTYTQLHDESRVAEVASTSIRRSDHVENSWIQQLPTPATTGETSSSDGDSMTDDLAAQMGSLKVAEDGQLRYYGPTSNLHIVHNGLFSLSRSTIRSVSEEGQAALQRAGVGNYVDPEIELHLTRLYFAWEDPAIHVVDEEMFHSEKQKWSAGAVGTSFYSETLNNAICAVGACLSVGVKLGVPEPASEFFSARAKALLDVEMDSPSVATVQALVVMSASEAAFTRDARGWLYSGMAVRLSADLGLHLDLSDHVRNGILTQREMEVRRTTFWGVFIHDNMWSLYVGRPWGINIRDISISRPQRAIDLVRKKGWSSYGNSQEPSSPATQLNLTDPVEACADANVSLCEMMRRISRTLYAGREIPVGELLTFASDTRQDFASWLEMLPPELQINVENPQCIYLPHILQLHMQFHTLSIFLHRPFFSRHLLRATASTAVQTTPPSTHPRHVCLTAAHAFVSVLRLYRTQHSLHQTNVQIVHLVFTAALVHVYSACTPSTTGAVARQAMGDLQFCIQALSEMSSTWRNATRALEVIICVKREWQGKAAAYRAKRPSESVVDSSIGADAGGHRRRRQRTLNPVELPLQSSEPKDVGGLAAAGYDGCDTWHFLNGTDLNFGVGGAIEDEELGAGGGLDEDALLMMDGFGDGDDLFGMGMLGSTNGLFGNGTAHGMI